MLVTALCAKGDQLRYKVFPRWNVTSCWYCYGMMTQLTGPRPVLASLTTQIGKSHWDELIFLRIVNWNSYISPGETRNLMLTSNPTSIQSFYSFFCKPWMFLGHGYWEPRYVVVPLSNSCSNLKFFYSHLLLSRSGLSPYLTVSR